MVRKAGPERPPISSAGPAERVAGEGGFTLIEVVCVLAIIALLAAILLLLALVLLYSRFSARPQGTPAALQAAD